MTGAIRLDDRLILSSLRPAPRARADGEPFEAMRSHSQSVSR